jgi:hypothetical protein
MTQGNEGKAVPFPLVASMVKEYNLGFISDMYRLQK